MISLQHRGARQSLWMTPAGARILSAHRHAVGAPCCRWLRDVLEECNSDPRLLSKPSATGFLGPCHSHSASGHPRGPRPWFPSTVARAPTTRSAVRVRTIIERLVSRSVRKLRKSPYLFE